MAHERILVFMARVGQTTFSALSIDFFCIEARRSRLTASQSKSRKKSFEADGRTP
jgi:hypothetical protein